MGVFFNLKVILYNMAKITQTAVTKLFSRVAK